MGDSASSGRGSRELRSARNYRDRDGRRSYPTEMPSSGASLTKNGGVSAGASHSFPALGRAFGRGGHLVNVGSHVGATAPVTSPALVATAGGNWTLDAEAMTQAFSDDCCTPVRTAGEQLNQSSSGRSGRGDEQYESSFSPTFGVQHGNKSQQSENTKHDGENTKNQPRRRKNTEDQPRCPRSPDRESDGEDGGGPMTEYDSDDEGSVSLWNLIDPAPYCIGPEFPLQRIYPLFISQYPVPAVVVRDHGELFGVLTRKHLTHLH